MDLAQPPEDPHDLDPEDWPARGPRPTGCWTTSWTTSRRSGNARCGGPFRARSGRPSPAPARRAHGLAEVHQEFLRLILPYATGNVHPGFMGWVHGGGNVAGMLGEMLAAGLNANLGGRDHMPIEVERRSCAGWRRCSGCPRAAGGLFVTGSSMANFMAVLVARTAALGPEVRRRGLVARPAPRGLRLHRRP